MRMGYSSHSNKEDQINQRSSSAGHIFVPSWEMMSRADLEQVKVKSRRILYCTGKRLNLDAFALLLDSICEWMNESHEWMNEWMDERVRGENEANGNELDWCGVDARPDVSESSQARGPNDVVRNVTQDTRPHVRTCCVERPGQSKKDASS
jgi:hypothetical protein